MSKEPERRSLYAIDAELVGFAELLEENGGDLEALGDRVDLYLEVEQLRAAKVDGYCAFIRVIELRAGNRKEEEKRIAELRKADENLAKRLKAALFSSFKTLGIEDELHTARFKVKIVKNGGKRPLIVDDVSLEEAGGEFVKVTESLDRSAIREAVESGRELDWARIGPQGERLRIK